MKLPVDDVRLAQHLTKARERVTNNGTKHDVIVSRFDQSGMTMQAAAKALDCGITNISYWQAGGRNSRGTFVPTNPAKQGALDSLMDNTMSPSGPPPARGACCHYFVLVAPLHPKGATQDHTNQPERTKDTIGPWRASL